MVCHRFLLTLTDRWELSPLQHTNKLTATALLQHIQCHIRILLSTLGHRCLGWRCSQRLDSIILGDGFEWGEFLWLRCTHWRLVCRRKSVTVMFTCYFLISWYHRCIHHLHYLLLLLLLSWSLVLRFGRSVWINPSITTLIGINLEIMLLPLAWCDNMRFRYSNMMLGSTGCINEIHHEGRVLDCWLLDTSHLYIPL